MNYLDDLDKLYPLLPYDNPAPRKNAAEPKQAPRDMTKQKNDDYDAFKTTRTPSSQNVYVAMLKDVI